MKRVCLLLTLAALLFCMPALADEAGVLTETELGSWLNNLLISTVDVAPLNAPIGEEALTQDGYAFIYDSATLYYNKPVLDAQSVLSAIAVTNESLAMPRGIHLGSPVEALLSAYGWQNPTLTGDDSFAPLYVLNRLPSGAYWALAQRSGNQLQSVQCAIHARAGADRYTDTGVLYTVLRDTVTAIRVYGLNTYTTRAEVENNLTAVGGSGVAVADTVPAVGVTLLSDAQPFNQTDLQLGSLHFLTLTEQDATATFGQPEGEAWAQDEGGQWLHTLAYTGASLVFGTDENKQNAYLESVSLNAAGMAGPRGLTVGMALQDAIKLFRCDGTGTTTDTAALLYGDGSTAPFGTLERTDDVATLRYAADATGAAGQTLLAVLHLTFSQDYLTEIMLYTY
ncbi:MAG: hypothetical protein LLF96_04580 [Eubacteriales bacterium]|nr:hypothetical protein [Eubacteriales bacterium]